MKNDFIEFLANARKRRPEKFRSHFYIFLSCLGISVFLWWLVKLSREYSYNVEYRLHYSQAPAGLRLVEFSDSLITTTIRVQGFEFFSDYFFRKDYHDYDVSLQGIKVKTVDDQYTGYLLSRNISKLIASESKYPMDVYSTSPDTLFFFFERKNLKKNNALKSRTTVVSPMTGNDSFRKTGDTIRLRPHEIRPNKAGTAFRK